MMKNAGSFDEQLKHDLSLQEGSILLREIAHKTFELGQATLTQYQAGQLSGASLVKLCDELLSLEYRMMGQTTEQTENSPAEIIPDPTDKVNDVIAGESPEPSESVQGDKKDLQDSQPFVCPQCGEAIQKEKKFCTICGYQFDLKAEAMPDVSPMANDLQSELAVPDSLPSALICAHCAVPIREDAKFCTSCGKPAASGGDLDEMTLIDVNSPVNLQAQMVQDVPYSPLTPAPMDPDKFCDNCGRGLTADIMVCVDCGGNKFS